MITTGNTRFFVHAGAIALTLALLLDSFAAFAAGKKGGGGSSKPPTPTNFRVTAKTAYTVTVAWDTASSSTAFNFHLSGAYNVAPVVLPSTARSHTFTALAPGNDYWFFIYAKNSAGTVSGQANLGPVRLPLDTTPPWTAPVVSVGDVGANYANLSWTRAEDDGPYHYSYELWLNGSLLYRSDFPRDVTSTVLRYLDPATAYTVQIRTYDFGGNPSPLSAPAAFTTLAANPNDTTPPTIPANVNAHGFGDGSTETQVTWTESTDNFDDPANIRYDIYVNGRLEDWIFGSGGPRIIYSDFGLNIIEVFATDTAGNTSAAGTTTVFF
ncbi:MAG TPA: fibronectin type III domain-containing protein [Verrucomicrobiae bacterium]|nr:fibronectin type III domain-containing protein [Verrucomicrobiae bacterium]